MSVLADRIEKYILAKMLEDSENVILKRNELADEMDCAPSQISYVLSTRFSNKRGFSVESRRGLGGFIRITRITMDQPRNVVDDSKALVERQITIEDIDAQLFQMLNSKQLTRREAAMLHSSFQTVLMTTPFEHRNQAVRQLFDRIIAIIKGV